MEAKDMMRHVRLNQAKALDRDGDTPSVTYKHMIQTLNQEFEDRVFEAIIKMAKDEGVTNLTILSKPAIAGALSKQIPQKPVYIPMQSLDDLTPYDWKCPHCNSYLGAIIHYPHCPQCGQKLDWENWQEEMK